MEVSKGKRFVAILIDGFIVCLVVGIITTIAVAMDVYAIAVVGYILGYGYYFVREQALGGQSVSHKVMGYKVVKVDGSSIKRDFLKLFKKYHNVGCHCK